MKKVKGKEEKINLDARPLNKLDKQICELIWGGWPTDSNFVRESKLFKECKSNLNTILYAHNGEIEILNLTLRI